MGANWPRRLWRFEPLILLLLPAVWIWLVWSPSWAPNPDAYYHVGCAELYAERGWLSSFPWLQHTTLGPHFPNLHFLHHVVLVPIAAVFEPVAALRLSTFAMAMGLFGSIYHVLRRWRVPGAALWTVLGTTSSQVIVFQSAYLKGGALFFILLVWIIDALAARSWRRVLVLSWLSTYAYTGNIVIVVVAVLWAGTRFLCGERRAWREPAAAIGGVLGAMIVNPFWPHHWHHLWAELGTVFMRSHLLVPGEFRGMEWAPMDGRLIVVLAAAPLVAWGVLLLRQLGRERAVDTASIAATVAALALFGGALMSGQKLVHLFLIASVLAIPRVAAAMRPWPRWVVIGAVVVTAGLSVRTVHRASEQLHAPGQLVARDFQVMAEWLVPRTESGETVLVAWDHFPGFFYFNKHNRYVAGMNPQFLLDADEKRFTAYALLYRGQVDDPENLLPAMFDGARFILVSNPPHTPGDFVLTGRLAANEHFEELAAPVSRWRVFRRRVE